MDDFQVNIVDDQTAPTKYKKALELVINSRKKHAIAFNAGTAKGAEFIDDSTYYSYGYFRKMRSQIEQISVNMPRVESYLVYDCAIGWMLDPWNQDYGMVQLRTKKSVENKQWGENVHHVADDTTWHYFELEGTYTSNPKSRRITRLVVDGSEYERDDEMWSYPQSWENSFAVDLATSNMYVECKQSLVSQAVSHYTKIGLVRIPV